MSPSDPKTCNGNVTMHFYLKNTIERIKSFLRFLQAYIEYVEELKRGLNADIGLEDIFEMPNSQSFPITDIHILMIRNNSGSRYRYQYPYHIIGSIADRLRTPQG